VREKESHVDKMKNYTYILQCSDGTLYTGWTNQLEKRIQAHNDGKGAKYTKYRRPVQLVYFEEFETKSEALRRECEIKKLTRQQKYQLFQ
jgi:putative endonuclease